ncbi:hypothetical protein EP7_003044 [Isosphaeraceae bacterium EP7]
MERPTFRRYFPTFINARSRIRQIQFIRLTALLIAVVVILMEYIWIQKIFQPWSLFGFEYFGMDFGVIGMMNFVLLGLYSLTGHHWRHAPFVVKFVSIGSMILLIFIAFGRMFPNATFSTSLFLSIPILPLYILGRYLPEDLSLKLFFTMIFTFPQLLLTLACTFMIRALSRVDLNRHFPDDR